VNKGQYKSAQHFYDMQALANSLNKKVLRIYGVPGHGKGEVDHVGGIVKVAIRKSVAAGETYVNSGEMVDFLIQKFESSKTNYVIRDIACHELDKVRSQFRSKRFTSIDGSSKFQCIIFTPGQQRFLASKLLYMPTMSK